MKKEIEKKEFKVRKRDGRLVDFDKEKIADAIWKAARAVGGYDRETSEKLADEITEILYEKYKKRAPTVEEIQDCVEKVLIEKGHAKTAKAYILYREEHAKLRDSRKLLLDSQQIIRDYIAKEDWRVYENANATYSYSGLLWHAAGTVMAYYGMNQVYPPEIAQAHMNGEIHLHDLSGSIQGYSFYRNEVVVVREIKTQKIFCLSLEQLYGLVNEPIIEKDGFEIKYTDNFEILDEKGFVPMIRVLRHKADKPLISFNATHGHNLIATEDHPFITLLQKKSSCCPKCKSAEVIKNRTNKNNKDYFKCKKCNHNFNESIKRVDLNLRQTLMAKTISKNNYVLTPKMNLDIEDPPSNLDEEDAWFIGFFLAEGWKNKYSVSFQIKKESRECKKLINYLKNKKIKYREIIGRKKDNSSEIHINNKKIVDWLKEFGIRDYSENKNLPINFLEMPEETIGAMISGIIDGDGSVRNEDKWVSRVVIRLTSKTLLSQIQYWMNLHKIKSSLCTIKGFGERDYNKLKIIPLKQLYSLTFFIPKRKKDLFSSCLKIDDNFKYSKQELKPRLFSDIRKIENLKNDSNYVYDITTDSHTFLCGGILVHNCAGWSLRQLLHEGFNGVPGKVECKAPKHLRSAVGQMINFMGTLQNEWAGAQAYNSFDTYLAPYVRADKLSYEQTKQAIQEFIFNMNVASRWGGQTVFSNVTLDLTVPEDLKEQHITIGGKLQKETYADYQDEIDTINKAFVEVMTEGDAKGRVFTFPIPTYNITRNFNWHGEISDKLFEMTAKYGLPYFQNFINSDLKPGDVRSMCCRLQLNLKELMKNVTGGLFGSGESTGSVGVVTINLPRTAYLARSKEKFFEKLEQVMYLAMRSLEIKRKVVEHNIEKWLLPYTKRYLGNLKNHFSTIGLVGMNEACLNLLGKDIASPEGKKFALETLDFMRKKIREYQEDTGHIYNLEATPAEGTSYRLARIDKKTYPEIITAGKKEPYYTNSTILPVNYTDDIFFALKHQEPLQKLYTGGTVFHTFLGENIGGRQAMLLVKKICNDFRLPYLTLTPTFSICHEHGYIAGEKHSCPTCKKPTEVYSRVVGYLRPVHDWNKGKQEEYHDRKIYNLKKANLKEE